MNRIRPWWFLAPGIQVFTHPNGYLAFYAPLHPEQHIECGNPCNLRAWA